MNISTKKNPTESCNANAEIMQDKKKANKTGAKVHFKRKQE